MIELACPNCGHVFPWPPSGGGSAGFCKCGLDFHFGEVAKGKTIYVHWRPDPAYPSSGDDSFTTIAALL